MSTTTSDQQTDAGKTPGQTAFEAYWLKIDAKIPKPKWENIGPDNNEDWNRVASAVLAKHMPQVTAHLMFRALSKNVGHDTDKDYPQRLADSVNEDLCARLVPEAAAEEWEEASGRHAIDYKWTVEGTEVGDLYDRDKWEPMVQGGFIVGRIYRRKKQAESPTRADLLREAMKRPGVADVMQVYSEHQPPQAATDGATPETDAHELELEELVRRFTNAAMPTQVVVTAMSFVQGDFARNLERQRNALREQVEGLKKELSDNGLAQEMLKRELTTAQKERDDALAVAGRHLTINQNLVAANRDKDAEIARLKEEEKRLDHALEQAVQERDDEGQFGSQLYFFITGNSPQWSNAFGHDAAEADVKEVLQSLFQERKRLEAELAALRTAPVKGLTVEQLNKIFDDVGCLYNRPDLMVEKINTILSTQPASPSGLTFEQWRTQRFGTGVTVHFDKELREAFEAGRGGSPWVSLTERRPTEKDAEDKAWKNHQMSESRPCNERDFRAGFNAALSTTGGSA